MILGPGYGTQKANADARSSSSPGKQDSELAAESLLCGGDADTKVDGTLPTSPSLGNSIVDSKQTLPEVSLSPPAEFDSNSTTVVAETLAPMACDITEVNEAYLKPETTSQIRSVADPQDTVAADPSTKSEPRSSISFWSLAVPVVVVAVLFALQPGTMSLVLSLFVNIVLIYAVVVLSRRSERLEARSSTPDSAHNEEALAMLSAAAGMQGLIDGSWSWARTWAAGLELTSTVTRLEFGDVPPKVLAVRLSGTPAEAPATDLVCYDVDMLWEGGSILPSVDLSVNIPGRTEPLVLRFVMTRFEGTFQFYFWNSPPPGRGNGRPYSLTEAAFAPEPVRPPVFALELSADTTSAMVNQMLPWMRQVAASVVETHFVPRMMGFNRRVVFDESPPKGQQAIFMEKEWRHAARRAGWLPRAEAELEGAVAEMVRRAGDLARDAAYGAGQRAVSGAKAFVSEAVGGAASMAQRPSDQASRASGAAASAVSTAAGAALGAASLFGISLSSIRGRTTGGTTPTSPVLAPAAAMREAPPPASSFTSLGPRGNTAEVIEGTSP